MDFKTVFDGIQYFYEDIVPKAFFSSDWNEESITNAFQWVKFCEEAYAKCTGENANSIDMLLHSTSGKLKKLYQTSLCFQDLQSCSTFLTQAFFENPKVEDDLIKKIVDNDKMNTNIFFENLEEAAALDTLCHELVESLKPISINSEKSFYYDIKSEIFIDYLKNSLKYLQTENVRESQLNSAFEHLCSGKENMTVFLHLLLLTSNNVDRETEEIQQFGMSWLLLKIYNNMHFPFVNFLFSQPVSKLRILSSKYSNFFDYYVETLTRCVNDLKENDHEMNWENRKLSSNELKISFKEALSHFCSLTQIEDDISKSIQQHISVLLKSNPDSWVWKDMAVHLFKK
ncbi:uncharacterized protein [Parasteatoda tepidariorum]|uniref:uncharacterized protein n=1 Tax=Parasteatoda tepidariorum TaxID=114398 RepID=UPI0039BD5545